MASKQAVLPINVKPIRSHHPCESCGVRTSQYKAEFRAGNAHVKHRLCKNCIEGIRL